MCSHFHNITFVIVSICVSFIVGFALPTSDKQKVCVIGAGLAGLVSTKHLADNSDDFDIVVFEKNSKVGGLWIYTNSTDLDQHGLPVHSSVYKSLRTNTAKETMALPDYYHFGGENSSVTHGAVLSYFKNYTEHFNLRQYIQFNTLVRKITPKVGEGDWKSTKYELETFNFDTNEPSTITCNALMICNGHSFESRLPKIAGIETFPGKTIHSHVYRVPEAFSGQTVAVLGAGPSGVDISLDLSDVAEKVHLSHNHAKMEVPLPPNIEQVSGIVAADGDTLILKDGTNITADAIIYCTGYAYSFPFLDENSGIVVDDNQVQHVYKHIVNIEHPSMGFIGLIGSGILFPGIDVQAKYFVSLLNGNFELPNEREMMKDFEKMVEGVPKRYSHTLKNESAYYDGLAEMGEFEPLPEFYEKGQRLWDELFRSDPWHFKDKNLVIKENGDIEIVDPRETTRN